MSNRRGSQYRKPNTVISDSSIPYAKRQEIINSPKFKACDIKLPFETIDEAKMVINKAGVTKSGYQRLREYECKYCGNFHLTSRQRKHQ